MLSVSDRLRVTTAIQANAEFPGEHSSDFGLRGQGKCVRTSMDDPFLGTAATVLELLFGVTLVLGLALRWAAFSSAGLLFVFGSAMAISFGIKSPFDYSVSLRCAAPLFWVSPARIDGASTLYYDAPGIEKRSEAIHGSPWHQMSNALFILLEHIQQRDK